MQKKLAKIISIVLGPVWLPVVLVLILYNSDLSKYQISILFPSLLILMVLIPISYLIIGPRFGWISSWEMKLVKERSPFLKMVLINTLLSLIIIYFWGNTLLLKLSITLLFLLLFILIISKFWKISIHTSLTTVCVILLNFIFNWDLLYLFFTIPIVYWARLHLKRHTNLQLLAGVVLAGTITSMGIFLLELF